MNAVTVALIVIAIHFGGIDVDDSRNGRIDVYRDSRPVAMWDLERTDNGVYVFGAAAESTVRVQRLAEPDGVYAVTVAGTGPPETLAVVSVPVMAVSSRSPRLQIARDEVVIAFTERGGGDSALPSEAVETSEGAVGAPDPAVESVDDAGASRAVAPSAGNGGGGVLEETDGNAASGGMSTYEVTVRRGAVTVSDATTRQLVQFSF